MEIVLFGLAVGVAVGVVIKVVDYIVDKHDKKNMSDSFNGNSYGWGRGSIN